MSEVKAIVDSFGETLLSLTVSFIKESKKLFSVGADRKYDAAIQRASADTQAKLSAYIEREVWNKTEQYRATIDALRGQLDKARTERPTN